MDSARTRTVVPLTAAALAVGLVLAGCGKDESSSTSSSSATSSSATSATSATSSTSSAAATPSATANYTALLMKVEDIPATPDGAFAAVGEPKVSTDQPTDVSQTFKSGPNVIESSVVINADAASATQWNNAVLASLPTHQTGTPVPVPSIAPDATFTSGTSLDGKAGRAAVLFTVDRTSAMLLFASPDGDTNPVPQDYAEAVGKVQAAAMQAGLAGLK